MDTKATIIVCLVLLVFLFGSKFAIGAELNEPACMEILHDKGEQIVIINQPCLMELYNVKLDQIKIKGMFSKKPKTAFCKIVRYHSFAGSGITVGGWFIEPAECLATNNKEGGQ